MRTLLLSLAVVVSATNARAFDSYQLSDVQISAVQDAILEVLKDADSAKFGTLGAGHMTVGEIIICGTVNAKNSAGGYVGYMPFRGHMWTQDTTFFLDELASNNSEASIILSSCGGIL